MKFCFGKYFCINSAILVTVIIIGVIAFYFKIKSDINSAVETNASQVQVAVPVVRHPSDKDTFYKRIYDVLEAPFRTYVGNYPKQGESGIPDYQKVGTVFRGEDHDDYNPDGDNRMPLYGRPRINGSSQFEYYTTDSSGNKIVVDETKELYDDDTVSVAGMTGDFTVDIYETQDMRYNPFSTVAY